MQRRARRADRSAAVVHRTVDPVVPERPGAADEPGDLCRRLARVLGEELAGLLGRDDTERFRTRRNRYRRLGR